MYLLKPIDEGLDVKLTGGIHSGCLRVQAGIKTDIRQVSDLKGKRIGISHMGSPPFLFASRVMAAHGLDPKNDVEWVTFPADAMELALDRGQVDAVANAEPIGTLLLGREKVHKVVDQATDLPYSEEFCCVTAVNGTFAAKNPKAAAAVTRAHAQGRQVGRCQQEAAARLAVEKGYLASTPELNVQAIKDHQVHARSGQGQERHPSGRQRDEGGRLPPSKHRPGGAGEAGMARSGGSDRRMDPERGGRKDRRRRGPAEDGASRHWLQCSTARRAAANMAVAASWNS